MGAARIYDYFAIVSHGLRAKTNFSYKKVDLIIIIRNFSYDYISDPNKSVSLLRKLNNNDNIIREDNNYDDDD